ncbi:MAG: PilZ domain-containing protein [Deltaproteobacteria bacterium]|nr:PilZ domain-containing protein [Deltaproteobacteria bacterium]MBW2052527.1 PilZ domain-containing protein [Deltaproteobacteria bacterium]MBW2140400.1 PilZ domain-containing protein [Deltaproteobacteria bacterium]
MPDNERRAIERFSLELPGQISISDKGNEESINLLTKDICAGGAFFHTEQPLPIGTSVRIDLVLSLEKLKKLEGRKALIKVSGQVIRSDTQGMAICFNKDYQLTPLHEEDY